MATWILIAIFGTVAVTAGLIAILQRINGQGVRGSGGDVAPIYVGEGTRRDADGHDSDAGSDGGDGGDGGE